MPTTVSLQLEERALSAAERLQRVRRQGQDLRQLGLTDKEAANQKLQATLQRTLTVRQFPSYLGSTPLTPLQVGGGDHLLFVATPMQATEWNT